MTLPLEDESSDIIAKAQLGMGFGDHELCKKTGLSYDDLDSVKQGLFDKAKVKNVAEALCLDFKALEAIAKEKWQPKPANSTTMAVFTTPYKTWTVNAYLFWDNFSSKAILFDTGTEANPILDFLRERELDLEAIMLTHTHPDHVAKLEPIINELSHPALFSPAQEPLEGSNLVEEGQEFRLGKITVKPLLTAGHSPGGMSYQIEGLSTAYVVCGDAIFSGSIGRVSQKHYTRALDAIREKLLSLPGNTILCPGHGPMTTVAEEARHNPFFAKKKRS